MTDTSLDQIRLMAMRILMLAVAALSAITVAADWAIGQADDGGLTTLIALALPVAPVLITLKGRFDAAARLTMAASLAAMPTLLLYVARGHPWQTDLHMIFFAGLAATAILCDWRAIAVSTAVVAFHHIVIGLVLPHWLFFGTGSFARVMLHAAILLAEAVALAWITQKLVVVLVVGAEKHQALTDKNEQQITTERQAEKERAAHLATLQQAMIATTERERERDLRELVGAISQSVVVIQTGSGEIAQASEELARRTESNAASLEETAASVTQMDGRLKASAQAASRTVERADQAIATVGSGRAVAEEAVQAMGRVSDSARGIDSVIEGLDKIAFQTRVLAMNAAVEAGRAGDAGRGFAVVADLVSALAMRAEEEAKRARDQLTVTQSEVTTAVEAVQRVDAALANISGDVGQVHELLATMAADNQAQSAAITQISAAIGTMDRATQQNAAMVEETSAAARNLASEVGGLTEQASRFNSGAPATGGHRTPGASPARANPRKADAGAYASPVKPLPAAGVAVLVGADSDDDWNEF